MRCEKKEEKEGNYGTTTWKWNNDRGSVPVVAIQRILLVVYSTLLLHDNDDDGPTHICLSLHVVTGNFTFIGLFLSDTLSALSN